MKTKIYNALVNKHVGIQQRYHRYHDGAVGVRKQLSWLYLFWLNFAYYVLFCKFLGKQKEADFYEQKRLLTLESESENSKRLFRQYSPGDYVERLKAYDVISFDVFDTLIFRRLSLPTDVFHLIGERLGIANFRDLRVWAELDARDKCREENGHTEITLTDIWDFLRQDIGPTAVGGEDIEKEIELSVCFANPFMLEVWKKLRDLNKTIVIVSDMYMPKDFIKALLEKNGFVGASDIFVSCEYKKNKAKGDLFPLVASNYSGASMVHIGDNPRSDYISAINNGIDALPYKSVDKNVMLYRSFDMSTMIGSAYRSTVTNHLYNGLKSFNMEYEYGFIYGGLFVLGYCHFIHEYCLTHGINKKLFLSRDGEILKKAYDLLYPGEDTVYVYLSRKAATKLMADYDKHDYFRRFVFHKANQDYTIAEVLKSMEMEALTDELPDWVGDASHLLTDKNAKSLRHFLETKWDKVLDNYKAQQIAAKRYYEHALAGADKAVAVDIGWAGSGALALDYLVNRAWGLDCDITGIVAGTNTIHNAEPDATEIFLQSGKLVSYLYSQGHNRDLLKLHNPNKDYNVFWELLLSSPTPGFDGFEAGRNLRDEGKDLDKYGKDEYLEDLDLTLHFGKYDYNLEGIKDIQSGIMDFVKIYSESFKDFPYMLNISGRDAYAPMIVAASHGEKYLKVIEKKFNLNINVE